MSTHIQIGCGSLAKSSKSADKDAKGLVADCAEGLGDPQRYPPKLFVLWLTPSFLPYDKFLARIHKYLDETHCGNIPLIGCSAAACVSDTGIHEKGATLVGFGSRFMEVHAAMSREAQSLPKDACEELALKLELSPDLTPAEVRSRLLLLFLPGFGPSMQLGEYYAGEIVEALRHHCPPYLAMFGGVASSGMNRDAAGAQFFGTEVHQRAVVGASITLNTTFRVGMSHGLKPTGDELELTLKKSEVPGQAIRTVNVSDVATTFSSEMPSLLVLGMERPVSGEQVISANVSDGKMTFSQPVPVGARLKVLRPNLHTMTQSVQRFFNSLARDLRIRGQKLAAALLIGCVARYRFRKEQGVAVGGAFKKLFRASRRAVHAGCYLDGELAGDSRSPFKLCNWSCPQILLADEIAVTYELQKGMDALEQLSSAIFTARSLTETMRLCLECIGRAGYVGGMISLIGKQGKIDGIIGQQAIGKGWESVVLKRTLRRLKGNDVLAVIARERKPRYIENAQASRICDRKTARLAGVISFYGAPLINERGEVFGIAQIDLGDLRGTKSLTAEQEKILHLLTQATASGLNRSILADELKLMQQFDELLPDCASRSDISDAISHFVEGATRILNADVHIRLREDSNQRILKLVSGIGQYYEACVQNRPRISITAKSPGAKAVRQRKLNVVNDADDHPEMKELLQHSKHAAIRCALRNVKAYANFPIFRPQKRDQKPTRRRVIGFVCIAAAEKYCFTPSRIRTLEHVVGRLSLLLTHIRQKMATEAGAAELKFLQSISPPIGKHAPIYELLNEHLQRIGLAAHAEVASCYLPDEIQDRLVLRAQVGWHSERRQKTWLDAAAYMNGEGFTGFISTLEEAIYIPNLREFARQKGLKVGKWFREMFGEASPEKINCEVIGLPLPIPGQGAGALVLYRRINEDSVSSGFATTDSGTLDKAARIYSSFITAILRVDLSGWRMAQTRKLQAISRQLLKLQIQPLDKILASYCELVVKEYGFRHCAVYLKRGGELQRYAHQVRRDVKDFNLEPHVMRRLGEVIASGKPLTLRSPRLVSNRTPLAYRSANIPKGIILPIKVDLKVVGLVLFLWRRRRSFKDTGFLPHHDPERLQSLADPVGIAVKNAQRRDEEAWREIQLRRAENRAWEVRAEACDRMADAVANGLQEIESSVETLVTALRNNAVHGIDYDPDHPVSRALVNLRNSNTALLKRCGDARTQLPTVESPQMVFLDEIIRRVLKGLEPGLHIKKITIRLSEFDRFKFKTLKRGLSTLLEELFFTAIRRSHRSSAVSLQVFPAKNGNLKIVLVDAAHRIPNDLCQAINSLGRVPPRRLHAWDLSLAHRIAHSIGGLLTVQSTVEGNQLTLTLPTNLYG